MAKCLKFEDQALETTHETKFLGIWLNDNISWEAHIRQLILKIKRNMILLKRSKTLLKQHALTPIYYGHIHSHLKYGIVIWQSMLSQSQMNQLQKLQDKAIQILDRHKNLEQIYSGLKIPNLCKMIALEHQKIWYHLINKLLPTNLAKLLNTNHKGMNLDKTHKYNTRNKAEPNLPSAKSLAHHNSFLHQSIKVFSALPNHVKT